MSSHESEQVLTLLKELSLLKELDSGYEAGNKTEAERDAHRVRQQRHPGDRGGTQGACGTKEKRRTIAIA